MELDGARYHVHANKLQKFHVHIDEVSVDPKNEYSHATNVNTCAIIYERDSYFGPVEVIDASVKGPDKPQESLPSEKIDPVKLEHLTEDQQYELLAILDEFADCFSETPGFCDLVEHEIQVTEDFKPKRLRAYKVPECLKPEVEKQINELLSLGFIRPSKSPMASPLVCVVKGKDGKDGVRLAVDYRYLNKFTIGDSYPTPNIDDIVQRIGKARWLSSFDAKGAYWQCKIRADHQWLTAFVCDEGLFEWVRVPFGLKNSGFCFMRTVKQLLQPIKRFADSYVDDMTVFSDEWKLHLEHLTKYLQRVRECGLTLNLKKCSFAQSHIKFCGHIIGSGKRSPDHDKLTVIQNIKIPVTKKTSETIIGIFLMV